VTQQAPAACRAAQETHSRIPPELYRDLALSLSGQAETVGFIYSRIIWDEWDGKKYDHKNRTCNMNMK
jgi:hypothetical protein